MLTEFFYATAEQRAAADRFFADCGIPDMHQAARAASDALLLEGPEVHSVAINMIKYDGALLPQVHRLGITYKQGIKVLIKALETLRLHYLQADQQELQDASPAAGLTETL